MSIPPESWKAQTRRRALGAQEGEPYTLTGIQNEADRQVREYREFAQMPPQEMTEAISPPGYAINEGRGPLAAHSDRQSDYLEYPPGLLPVTADQQMIRDAHDAVPIDIENLDFLPEETFQIGAQAPEERHQRTSRQPAAAVHHQMPQLGQLPQRQPTPPTALRTGATGETSRAADFVQSQRSLDRQVEWARQNFGPIMSPRYFQRPQRYAGLLSGSEYSDSTPFGGQSGAFSMLTGSPREETGLLESPQAHEQAWRHACLLASTADHEMVETILEWPEDQEDAQEIAHSLNISEQETPTASGGLGLLEAPPGLLRAEPPAAATGVEQQPESPEQGIQSQAGFHQESASCLTAATGIGEQSEQPEEGAQPGLGSAASTPTGPKSYIDVAREAEDVLSVRTKKVKKYRDTLPVWHTPADTRELQKRARRYEEHR